MQTNIQLNRYDALISTDYPYVVCPIAPAVFAWWVLPQDLNRPQLVKYCRERVAATETRHALVLGARECVYFEPDGTAKCSNTPPTGGLAMCQNADDRTAERRGPNYPRVPESRKGREIARDEDAGCCWKLERTGKRGRWRIRRRFFNEQGATSSEIEAEGDAWTIYKGADHLGIDRAAVAESRMGVPTPEEICRSIRDEHLRGKRFGCEILGSTMAWWLEYSIFRDREGWHIRVAGEQDGYDLLEGPPTEEHGPFRTKAEVREALEERGLDSDVEF